MPKLRVEAEGPEGPVFISRDGQVVQQSISRLILSFSNDGRTLVIGQPVQDALSTVPYEAQITYLVGKTTLILEYAEG